MANYIITEEMAFVEAETIALEHTFLLKNSITQLKKIKKLVEDNKDRINEDKENFENEIEELFPEIFKIKGIVLDGSRLHPYYGDLLVRLQEDWTFLISPFYYDKQIETLDGIHETTKYLIERFKIQTCFRVHEKYHREEYNFELLKKCKFFIQIQRLQALRREKLKSFLEAENSVSKLDRLYSKYKEELEVFQSSDPWSKSIFVLKIYEEEKQYLKDAIPKNVKKEVIPENKPSETAAERKIKEIRQMVETEVNIENTCDDLVKQFPQYEAQIRKRFRKLLDSIREGEL